MCKATNALLSGLVLTVLAGSGSAESAGATANNLVLRLKVVEVADQRPICQAKVSVRFYGDVEGTDQFELLTAPDGGCEVSVPLPQPRRVRLFVEASGYVRVRVDSQNTDNPPRREAIPPSFVVPLEKSAPVGGIVRNKDGHPIPGAKLNLALRADEGKIRHYVEHTVTTDADGRWKSDAMPQDLDQLYVEVTHPDYVSIDLWVSSTPTLKQSLPALATEITMDEGITVSGVVYDEQGQPIKDALLLTDRADFFSKVARTNERGQFDFKHCKREALHITAQASGRSPVCRRVLEQNLTEPVNFTLGPGRTIRLRVVDAAGNPVEGVYIIPETYKAYRYILKPDPPNMERGMRTNDQGRACWTSAPPDAVQYAFSKKGYARLSDVALVADGQEHIVTLTRPVTVRGTVVDKNTAEPIARFRVVPVLNWLDGGTPSISRGSAFEARDGKFEWKVSRTDTGHHVRIEADGYRPVVSEMFHVAEAESRTFHFELDSATNIRGVVVAPDGEPVEGARVCLSTAMEYLSMSNGTLSRLGDTYQVVTGADGVFSFPPETSSALIVVLHDEGSARVTPEQLSPVPRVVLQPWARVEGRLLCRGKPIKNYELWLWPIHLANPDAPRVSAQYHTRTDANGEFVFARVAPGPVFVKPDLSPWEPSELTSAQHAPLIARPGQTHELTLNEAGRTIVGKAVLPPGRSRKMTWDYGLNYLIALKEGIPAPDGLEHFKDAWRRGWNETWDASREGDTYINTLHKHFVKLNIDGTFRIEGVAPGKHQLVLRIYDAPKDTGCLVNPVATALADVDVPDPSRQGDVLDIGNVVVDLCAALRDGDPAPPFQARTVDGKTVTLQDYRGKVVLLVFWATWCGPCVAELPTLQAIHSEFANDPRLVIVSLSLDKSVNPVHRLAQQRQLRWVQGHLGDWSETDVPSQYGVSYLPAAYLIGPYGEVLAQKISGPEVRKRIEKALNE